MISDVLQLVLLIDIQVFVKRKVGGILICQLSIRLVVQEYAFLSKKYVFLKFLIDIFFSIYHPKIMNENKSVFCVRYRTPINGMKTKIVSYTKLKSTVGLTTELSDSLKKLETGKN